LEGRGIGGGGSDDALSLSLGALPDGAAWYAYSLRTSTTTDLTPQQIHDLGLSEVNLSDGSYSKTRIYPVTGIPGNTNTDQTVGDFYVQFSGATPLCAYHVPGGSFAMRFTDGGFTNFEPDGLGGTYLIGTFELTILEATGIYHSFVGGHNHMVDKLHQLANGSFDEYCFCFISRA